MRTRFRLHMPTANALGAAFFVGALGMAAPAAAQKLPIKVGEFLDLTGGVATAAEAARLGIDLAIKEINDAGGIDGRKL